MIDRVERLTRQNQSLERENQRLKTRLARIEQALGIQVDREE